MPATWIAAGTLLKPHDPFYTSRKVSEIQEEFIHNGRYSKENMDATVRCLQIYLRTEQNRPISKHYNQFVALRNSIYNTPSAFFTVKELAASLNMSV